MKYAITLTLKPQMYRYTVEEQYQRTRDMIRNIFEYYDVSIVAELTEDFNVHYHGLIELKDEHQKNTLINRFRGSLVWGRKTIDQVTDENGWIEYLKKDVKRSFTILGQSPIVIDKMGILETPKEFFPSKVEDTACATKKKSKSIIIQVDPTWVNKNILSNNYGTCVADR